MATEGAQDDFDVRERQLSAELDAYTAWAGEAIQWANLVGVQNMLHLMAFRQPEAQRLAAADRPAQAARLEAMTADLSAAFQTMGGTASKLQAATMADTKMEAKARAEREAVWQTTLKEQGAAAQERAKEGRKLL